jgi:rhamnulokinase
MAEKRYLAFDLGAESGRGIMGLFDGEYLRLEEVNRFPNGSVRLLETLHWDVLRLFAELKRGLAQAVSTHGKEIASLGIDTWGVDFGLLGRGDVLLGNPRHYRDHANDGIMEIAFERVPRADLFARTGIQFMQFNTLFQLLALQRMNSPLLENAQSLLMMPDLLNFFFTGVKATEYSIASTTQMIDPYQREWDRELLTQFNLPTHILTPLLETGATVGNLRADIAEEAGCGALKVIAPAEHDTGSAIVSVPATTTNYAYISSGTWSLMGIETKEPRISPATATANVTNEGGAFQTVRLLKNIMGLWLVQECRRAWARRGTEYTYANLTEQAALANPFTALIEPDAAPFLSPTDMVTEIARFCEQTGQTAPQSVGETVRVCLESLALKYRWVLERMEEFQGAPLEVIHIVGGGTQNRLLCQLAADATRRTVIAGPVEATAIGNLLMQAYGCGDIGSLEQAREVVRRSFDLITYTPQGDAARWEESYAKYLHLREQLGNP